MTHSNQRGQKPNLPPGTMTVRYACREFGITREEIEQAATEGKLKAKPYPCVRDKIVNRKEIARVAASLHAARMPRPPPIVPASVETRSRAGEGDGDARRQREEQDAPVGMAQPRQPAAVTVKGPDGAGAEEVHVQRQRKEQDDHRARPGFSRREQDGTDPAPSPVEPIAPAIREIEGKHWQAEAAPEPWMPDPEARSLVGTLLDADRTILGILEARTFLSWWGSEADALRACSWSVDSLAKLAARKLTGGVLFHVPTKCSRTQEDVGELRGARGAIVEMVGFETTGSLFWKKMRPHKATLDVFLSEARHGRLGTRDIEDFLQAVLGLRTIGGGRLAPLIGQAAQATTAIREEVRREYLVRQQAEAPIRRRLAEEQAARERRRQEEIERQWAEKRRREDEYWASPEGQAERRRRAEQAEWERQEQARLWRNNRIRYLRGELRDKLEKLGRVERGDQTATKLFEGLEYAYDRLRGEIAVVESELRELGA